jgi:hypothetical protein
MSRRALVYLPLALVFAAAFAIPAVAARSKSGDTARAGDASWHRVDLHWKPDALDVIRPNPIILDTIDSFGPPFGFNRPGEMRTPRSQIGTDQRSGKWKVFLTRGNNPGSCFGTFALDRRVIRTTATYQIVKYDGAARLGGCRGVRKFRDVVPGRLGALTGRTVCRVRGCDGGLDIKGNIRY